jgi:DNA-binding CsgD family transcriptional regulator
LTVLGQVRARRGDPDIWPPLDAAAAMAEGTGELRRLGPLAAARAEAAWLAGDPVRAVAETRLAFDLAIGLRHSWFAGSLAYWRWKGGDGAATPDWLAGPYALQIAGDWQGAAAAWRALGCPYETAMALSEGDDDAALREAFDVCSTLGARPLGAVVTGRLRQLGVSVPRGPRRATRESPAGLTQREAEILGLLAQGLRNAEIAEALFLSKRTVDHHVSAILRKLDARTRGEAVAAATRLGALDPS